METQKNTLGEPDVQFGALKIWIHGRQFPQSVDDQSEWLVVTLKCSDDKTETWVKHEPILNLAELMPLRNQLVLLSKNKIEKIRYFHTEPELDLNAKVVPPDKIEMDVEIMPDTTKAPYRYLLVLERDQLLDSIQDLDKVFDKYPFLTY